MLPIYCTYRIGDISSGSELLNLFPGFRFSRAVQTFVLEFSKDGSADLVNEFTDGGSANQPVVLQGGVIASCNPTSKGFLKLGTDFLMRWCVRSLMKWYSWILHLTPSPKSQTKQEFYYQDKVDLNWVKIKFNHYKMLHCHCGLVGNTLTWQHRGCGFNPRYRQIHSG